MTDELSKLQSWYAKSISNLQNQYIGTTRNWFKSFYCFKNSFSNNWTIYTLPNIYTDQVRSNSNEFANNYTKIINIGYKVAKNSIDRLSEKYKELYKISSDV